MESNKEKVLQNEFWLNSVKWCPAKRKALAEGSAPSSSGEKGTLKTTSSSEHPAHGAHGVHGGTWIVKGDSPTSSHSPSPG